MYEYLSVLVVKRNTIAIALCCCRSIKVTSFTVYNLINDRKPDHLRDEMRSCELKLLCIYFCCLCSSTMYTVQVQLSFALCVCTYVKSHLISLNTWYPIISSLHRHDQTKSSNMSTENVEKSYKLDYNRFFPSSLLSISFFLVETPHKNHREPMEIIHQWRLFVQHPC